ncbi:MAG: hypothetical protein IMZ55_03115 [Acidobacteria bacterium]|nr:hypothetical protein [Acidobacteriota bacterium]
MPVTKWVSLLLGLLVVVGGFEGGFVCIGDNGRFAFESSKSDCAADPCARPDGADAAEAQAPVLSSDECGSCNHLPLPSWTGTHASFVRPPTAHARADAAPSLPAQMHGAELAAGSLPSLAVQAASSSAEALLSVVLLI